MSEIQEELKFGITGKQWNTAKSQIAEIQAREVPWLFSQPMKRHCQLELDQRHLVGSCKLGELILASTFRA